ncbi:Guanine nucleotide-binding protein-like 3-like protein [Mortierella polycephala]|uniref:Guanine nucleotide-binding protein-like 3-like protein n=1 Tax=Mortierella polycephala TaxID=41804 RepID=A0A9P6PZJ4_9FUNG|nr:Guanine nucleotide-binding protein-like 3-like protein [Mortierella polycephala]
MAIKGIVVENRSKDQSPKKGGSKTQNKSKKNTKSKKKNSKSKPEPTTESTAKDEARKIVRFKTVCSEGRLQLQRYIESIDVILVVLDARDPQRCRSRFLEQWAQENDKKIIFVLNKIDLVPQSNASAWIKPLSQLNPTVAFMATDAGASTGADQLVRMLRTYASKCKQSPLNVGIVGYASVGRSSVLQSLKNSKELSKSQDTIKVKDKTGTIVGKGGPIELLLRSKILPAVEFISSSGSAAMRCRKETLMVTYMVPTFDNGIEFLDQLARQQGCLKKGGVPDTLTAARFFFKELTSDKLSFYTTPPAIANAQTTSTSLWIKEFGMDIKDHIKQLESMTFPTDRSFVLALASQEPDDDVVDQEDDDQRNQDENMDTIKEEAVAQHTINEAVTNPKKRASEDAVKKQPVKKVKKAQKVSNEAVNQNADSHGRKKSRR